MLCFLSSFVFHLHPALAFLISNSVMSFYLSLSLLSLVISLPEYFTLLLLFSKQLLCLLLWGSCCWQPVWEEEKEDRTMRVKGREQYALISKPKLNVMSLFSHGVRFSPELLDDATLMTEKRGWAWWNRMRWKIKIVIRGNRYKEMGLPTQIFFFWFQIIQHLIYYYLNMSK